jgi:hypothetical protein
MTSEHHASRQTGSRHPLLGPSLTIECAQCPVKSTGCADCMVTALLQIAPPERGEGGHDLHWSTIETSMPLDQDEWAAVEAFARAGLISTAEAGGARAKSTVAPVLAHSRHRDRESGGRAVG